MPRHRGSPFLPYEAILLANRALRLSNYYLVSRLRPTTLFVLHLYVLTHFTGLPLVGLHRWEIVDNF